jgi:hypothetical protein
MFEYYSKQSCIQQELENGITINIIRKKASCRIQTANNKARKRNLIGNLTKQMWRSILLDDFAHRCALTGKRHPEVELDLGHYIPNIWGHGGTYKGNVFPIERSLNISLRDYNPLVFIPRNAEYFGISLDAINRLVEYLARINGLSIQQYSRFVQWCHGYPLTDYHNRNAVFCYLNNVPTEDYWRIEGGELTLNNNITIDSLSLWKAGLFSDQ